MDLFCASNVGNAKYVHILFIKNIYYLICPGLNYQQANYGRSFGFFFFLRPIVVFLMDYLDTNYRKAALGIMKVEIDITQFILSYGCY